MEDFLKNMLNGIENNMKQCLSSSVDDLKKPFDQVYDEVRKNQEGIISFEEYRMKKKRGFKKIKEYICKWGKVYLF